MPLVHLTRVKAFAVLVSAEQGTRRTRREGNAGFSQHQLTEFEVPFSACKLLKVRYLLPGEGGFEAPISTASTMRRWKSGQRPLQFGFPICYSCAV